ncbi:MAG TPA: hypothetical protein V6D29_12525, partial [Leptolyngbyaceae cyanobacterium]
KATETNHNMSYFPAVNLVQAATTAIARNTFYPSRILGFSLQVARLKAYLEGLESFLDPLSSSYVEKKCPSAPESG